MTDLPARLIWATESGLQTYILSPEEIVTLGRDPSNDIIIPLGAVSRNHAQIEWIGTSYVLSDLGSANGTYVNGNLVGSVPWILRNGNRIQLSDFRILFHIGDLPDNVEDLLKNSLLNSENPLARGLVQTAVLKEQADLSGSPGIKPNNADVYQHGITRSHRLVATSGLDSGRRFDLQDQLITVGYAGFWTNFDIELNDPSVSQPHAQLEKQDDAYQIKDLGSKRGTRINGNLITQPTTLQEGDVLLLGEARLVYRRED